MCEILKVEKISKSYRNIIAVNNLSFSVERGTTFGLLGANGAGKTTTIECILGTKKTQSGLIEIFGKIPLSNRKLLFEKIGVQFQEAKYQENIKVGELCEVTASLYKHPNNYKEFLQKFGLSDKEKSLVKELSGGQKQKLFIILALIPNPEIVFLDELTTGLDARARRDVWKILKDLKKHGLTIIMTSHFMDEVEELCDKICILKKGSLIFYGTVNEAIEQSPMDKFEDAYLWYTDEEVINDESL